MFDIFNKIKDGFCCNGGQKCIHCGPKGKKERRLLNKQARQILKNEDRKEQRDN